MALSLSWMSGWIRGKRRLALPGIALAPRLADQPLDVAVGVARVEAVRIARLGQELLRLLQRAM